MNELFSLIEKFNYHNNKKSKQIEEESKIISPIQKPTDQHLDLLEPKDPKRKISPSFASSENLEVSQLDDSDPNQEEIPNSLQERESEIIIEEKYTKKQKKKLEVLSNLE